VTEGHRRQSHEIGDEDKVRRASGLAEIALKVYEHRS